MRDSHRRATLWGFSLDDPCLHCHFQSVLDSYSFDRLDAVVGHIRCSAIPFWVPSSDLPLDVLNLSMEVFYFHFHLLRISTGDL